MKSTNIIKTSLSCLILTCFGAVTAAPNTNISKNSLSMGHAVKSDISPKLSELIRITNEQNGAREDNLRPADYVYPNVVENPEKLNNADRTPAPDFDRSLQDTKGLTQAPPVSLSFDGIGQSDAPGGGLPPDTNGDVGIDFYVQYVNTDWAIYDKTNGNLVGSVNEGNTFWAGFGGPCQTNNAGDPIVLFDKIANVWVFSQFVSSANPNGSQCFAVSDRQDITDPNVVFHRYQFDFDGVFNDYPHIGIWTDESGKSSGYYIVTHDFQLPGVAPFVGSSFSVVERDKMLSGDPAQFVRFSNVSAFGASSFGALPAHLESIEKPAAGSCAPFVHRRSDLDAYLLWSFCVDWENAGGSFLSTANRIAANVPYGTGVNRVTQPAPAPAGAALDPFGGNTMYRASARAYPAASGLPTQLVINHVADAGNGHQGVRWVDFSLAYDDLIYTHGFEADESQSSDFLLSAKIINQGLFSPDSESRWMGAISIDKSSNIGLGYSVASSTVFPSVRYTGRTQNDPSNTLQDEQNCVVGTGVQTFVDGGGRASRWGDYSSMSVDPTDQCTFWMSVEYVANTGVADWENRVCSFKFPTCGDANLVMRSDTPDTISVCTLNGTPDLDLGLFALDGLTGNTTLSSSVMPGGSGITFATNPVSAYPTMTSASLDNLNLAGSTNFPITITATTTDAPVLTRTLGFNIVVSSTITPAANLTLPVNGSTGQLVRPNLVWDAVADALSYTIEVATDVAFTNIVETATSEVPSHTVQNTLDSSTEYFWRVTASNNCGAGSVSVASSFTTGIPGSCPAGTSPSVAFTDDLEGDVSDWTTPAAPVGTNTWAQSGVRANSGVSSFLGVDSDVSSDQHLVSPSIVLPSIAQSPITLSYWNFQSMEANTGTGDDACWDGSFIEISTDGGNTFNPIDGANLFTDPYNGKITVNAASPISGIDAWCANAAVPASGVQESVSVVDLDQFAGQTVQFRFRVGTDGNTGDEGWYIDDVEVQGCVPN